MRFLLDTVTISEFRRKEKAHPRVRNWQESIGDVWLSVITLNELRYGMRKIESRDPVFASHLATWYSQIIMQPQRFRILPVDRAIAELAADFRGAHGTSVEDSLIAATAKVHNLTVATRNTSHFEACGVEIENPWEFSA
jgi:predicted nucleic acid-binding protein